MTRIERLKVLLGLPEGLEPNQEQVLQFVLDETVDFICQYCGIREVPAALENTLLAMAVDGYRVQGLGSAMDSGNVKSVTEGKVRLEFDSTSLTAKQKRTAWLSYAEQLNRFRKAGWQCEALCPRVSSGEGELGDFL